MDNRFSCAIHILILISESDTPMTSAEMAVSVGTNASYVRKIAGLLKNRGILRSRQGAGGFALEKDPGDLTLYEIYEAIYETEQVHVFDLHQNSSDECIVGRHIRPVLTETFQEIGQKAEMELKRQTLADCIRRMRQRIDETEPQAAAPSSGKV